MASVNAAFNQADANQDQRLDINEFRNYVSNQGVGSGLAGSSYSSGAELSGLGAGGYGSSYQSSYESSAGGLGGGAGYVGAAGLGNAGVGASSYESSSYSTSVGGAGADLGGAAYNASSTSYGVSGGEASSANYTSTAESTTVQQYATDAQGLFQDSNPQIIRRPAPGGVQTYTQNIRVRFLQPPPVAPHGPLIIKEVRAPQPPVPAPLRIRQQAPPLPTPPPLVLRERPPVPPSSIASQTVIRRLAPVPVPPRSVIIERIAAAPARPRDIIIERWVPYGALAKRRTIVQRAGAAQQYAQPRNVIIQYEAPQVRIVRQFQRLGVTQESPQAYVQRYGGQLLEAGVLVQQARSAGVVEDIAPPAYSGASYVANSSQYSSNAGYGADAAGYGASSYGASGYGAEGLAGASTYESASYSSSSDLSGLGAGVGLGFGGVGEASTYESSSSYSTTGNVLGGSANAAFAAADTNRDGVLSQSEFRSAGY